VEAKSQVEVEESMSALAAVAAVAEIAASSSAAEGRGWGSSWSLR